MLDMRGRRALVVGAGGVGLRKARGLRDAGAAVTLVSPVVSDDADLEGIDVLREGYRADHMALEGLTLVFACTDDRELNARIAHDARHVGALVNAVDQPPDCDFYAPAVIRDGEVVVAIGTGGSSPALAGSLRRRLTRALPERIGAFAEAVGRLRRRILDGTLPPQRREVLLKRLAGDEAYEVFIEGGDKALERRVDDETHCP
jgi:precorrin-2 dehydrogenase/sirohydrochlorin ferrochelatase